MSPTFAIKEAFRNFFAEAAGIISTEKTFHALFCHHLAAAGVPLSCISREGSHDNKRVDVLIYQDGLTGAFSHHADRVVTAFEFKGGAYGNRNALAGEIRPDGFCEDIEKLEYWSTRAADGWFICIDIAGLGKRVKQETVKDIAVHCALRGLGFAYFYQEDDNFLMMAPGTSTPVRIQIDPLAAHYLFSDSTPDLRGIADMVATTGASVPTGSEDDHVFRLYQALREQDYSAKQVSLETYFSFAKRPGSRMHLRPDVCVFDAAVDGNFNLYRNGRVTASNDALKLATLRALIEVKGSAATAKTAAATFAGTLRSDISKLAAWKQALNAEFIAQRCQRSSNVVYAMLAFDTRPIALDDSLQIELARHAGKHGIHFEYRHVSVPAAGRPRAIKPTSIAPTPVAANRQPIRLENPTKQTVMPERISLPREALPRLHRRVETPKRPRELAVYFAAILQATRLQDGHAYPLNRFLKNLTAHTSTGRLIAVQGGYRLSDSGRTYFDDRFLAFGGGPLTHDEVAAECRQIIAGNHPDWVELD